MIIAPNHYRLDTKSVALNYCLSIAQHGLSQEFLAWETWSMYFKFTRNSFVKLTYPVKSRDRRPLMTLHTESCTFPIVYNIFQYFLSLHIVQTKLFSLSLLYTNTVCVYTHTLIIIITFCVWKIKKNVHFQLYFPAILLC